ncbi:uncharacterized protein LOC123314547 [Coccinella septempunctata]|uniref:uncharacterized protein LOC123314547 n=1 Tax=Coccinella septempunctata TaxID=41139 RepID=UPI001D08DEB9|nr:uncharacterized protein LOC123314547 [Coccinella septempunctata]
MVKASDTGGVQPMTIQGRLIRERERLVGMTDEERAFRAKFVKAQILSPNEPRVVPELYKEYNNPIRRFYKYPLNQFQKFLEPKVGPVLSLNIRYFTGKALLGLAIVYYSAYYFKYNGHDWTRKGGWKVTESKQAVLPGEPGYPKLSDKTKPSDFATKGFEKVTLNL